MTYLTENYQPAEIVDIYGAVSSRRAVATFAETVEFLDCRRLGALELNRYSSSDVRRNGWLGVIAPGFFSYLQRSLVCRRD